MAEGAKRWREVRTGDGTWTLAHPGHGEACHSHVGARLESHERYVMGCALPARWSTRREGPWRILDVGTGVGWNLAATLEARAVEGSAPALELVTLESSAEVLRAGAELERAHGQGEAMARVQDALERARDGAWVDVQPGVRLRLFQGDARDAATQLAEEGEAFDAFYLDAFSPRVEGELWQEDFLSALRTLAAPGARLATYCAATRVRVALLLAGWSLGQGPRVGGKAEGTWGGTDLSGLHPFDAKTQRRLLRRAREARAGDFERLLAGATYPEAPKSASGSPRSAVRLD